MSHQKQVLPTIFGLRIYPTYSVRYRVNSVKYFGVNKYESKSSLVKSESDFVKEKNLQNNNHGGELSKKSVQKLRNAINWLVASAKKQRIRNVVTGKMFDFRISFVTLVLPFDQGDLSDSKICNMLLNPLLMTLKNRYGLKNYVWKAEAQKNGNIHFHITTDAYLPYDELRYLWNRLIEKKGLMSGYTDKFSRMSKNEYVKYRLNEVSNDSDSIDLVENSELEKIIKAYEFGVNTGWKNPNSTDVKAVRNVKDLAAYLATYMSKKEKNKRKITGRLWSCSHSLSASNKCEIIFEQNQVGEVMRELMQPEIKSIDIKSEPDSLGVCHNFAEIFLYDFKYLIKNFKGLVKDVLVNHLSKIRGGIDLFGSKLDLVSESVVSRIESVVIDSNKSVQLSCNF